MIDIFVSTGTVCVTWSLSHNKMLDWSKFKAFADDSFNMATMMKIVSHRTEIYVEKGKNAFLLYNKDL